MGIASPVFQSSYVYSNAWRRTSLAPGGGCRSLSSTGAGTGLTRHLRIQALAPAASKPNQSPCPSLTLSIFPLPEPIYKGLLFKEEVAVGQNGRATWARGHMAGNGKEGT